MTNQEFTKIMEDLASAFDVPKNERFSKRMKIYEKYLIDFSSDKFKFAIKELCKSAERFPTIKQIIETAKLYKRKKSFFETDDHDCPICESTGFVITEKGSYSYCFRCPECDISDKRGIPKFTPEHKEKGYKLIFFPGNNF